MLGLAFGVSLAACGDETDSGSATTPGLRPSESFLAKDQPIDGLSDDDLRIFARGDELFNLPLRPYDGLGPLYTRDNCGSCHLEGMRGPGMVHKMSVMEADGVTPSPNQSKLPFGPTVHPLMTGDAVTPIIVPEDDPSIKVSTRVGPPVIGRGYMEAVEDSEIERLESEQAARTDGISGRINRVKYGAHMNPDPRFHSYEYGDSVIGRFGLKAVIATVDEFTADALQNDMGITSPLRPTEFPNPDGLLDDLKPGLDITADSVAKRADYVRMLALSRRSAPSEEGLALFASAHCDVCHAPKLKTRADYPIAPIAGYDAEVFTDFLLHDMGDALADGLEGHDGTATGREWRTAPLMGMSLMRTFLHDGRAASIGEAIQLHAGPGSEANQSIASFNQLSKSDQQALIAFVTSL